MRNMTSKAIRLALFMAALAIFGACGGRVPPEVTMTTDHYLGSWIKEADLTANIEAQNGGAGTFTVITISNSLEILEEVRVPGQEKPAEAIVVGRLFATLSKAGELKYNAAQLKEVKVGRLSDPEIASKTERPLQFIVSVDRKTAVLIIKESVAGVEKDKEKVPYVKIDEEQRKQLKLSPKPVSGKASAPAGKPPAQPDPRAFNTRK